MLEGAKSVNGPAAFKDSVRPVAFSATRNLEYDPLLCIVSTISGAFVTTNFRAALIYEVLSGVK
jgi:hypothetical protein